MKLFNFSLIFCLLIYSISFSGLSSLLLEIGSRHTALGGSGVALSEDIYSAYYNPASLPAMHHRTHALSDFGYFWQTLVPTLGLKDMYQIVFMAAFYPPWKYKNISFGAAYYHNLISQGEMAFRDEVGGSPRFTYRNYDNINNLAFGVGYRDFIRIGLTLKHISMHSLEDSWGFAADIGLQLSYPFYLTFLPIIFEPSLGAVYRNAGFNPEYGESSVEMTMPREYSGGAAVRLDLMEYAGLTGTFDVSDGQSYGFEIRLTPVLAVQAGWMNDENGMRKEKIRGASIMVDLKRLRAFIHRIRHGDYNTRSEDVRKIYMSHLKIGNITLPLNLRAGLNFNAILSEGQSESPREKQIRIDLNLGI
jgi:hypothetical protein